MSVSSVRCLTSVVSENAASKWNRITNRSSLRNLSVQHARLRFLVVASRIARDTARNTLSTSAATVAKWLFGSVSATLISVSHATKELATTKLNNVKAINAH